MNPTDKTNRGSEDQEIDPAEIYHQEADHLRQIEYSFEMAKARSIIREQRWLRFFGTVVVLSVLAYAIYDMFPKKLEDVKVIETGLVSVGGTYQKDGYPDTDYEVPFVKVEGLEDCLVGRDIEGLKKGDVLKEVKYRSRIAACDQLLNYKVAESAVTR